MDRTEKSGRDAAFHHISVLPEAASRIVGDKSGIYVDCTLGGGGHSAIIASELNAAGRLIGIDQDAAAIAAARAKLAAGDFPCQIEVVQDNFSNLDEILAARDLGGRVDGIIFDLGVSSHQIDTPQRGFSYMHDAPLDMRMSRDNPLTAAKIVNDWTEDELARIFFEYGEERWAKRIAAFIAERRKTAPLETTGELVDVIERAIPKAVRDERSGHAAKKVFQAVRIAVNDELGILSGAIESAIANLRAGGRLAVITFHSLEDRIVKNTMQAAAKGCTCPPRLPVCVCGKKPQIKILGKAIAPNAEEIRENSRAASAKLRLAEKI